MKKRLMAFLLTVVTAVSSVPVNPVMAMPEGEEVQLSAEEAGSAEDGEDGFNKFKCSFQAKYNAGTQSSYKTTSVDNGWGENDWVSWTDAHKTGDVEYELIRIWANNSNAYALKLKVEAGYRDGYTLSSVTTQGDTNIAIIDNDENPSNTLADGEIEITNPTIQTGYYEEKSWFIKTGDTPGFTSFSIDLIEKDPAGNEVARRTVVIGVVNCREAGIADNTIYMGWDFYGNPAIIARWAKKGDRFIIESGDEYSFVTCNENDLLPWNDAYTGKDLRAAKAPVVAGVTEASELWNYVVSSDKLEKAEPSAATYITVRLPLGGETSSVLKEEVIPGIRINTPDPEKEKIVYRFFFTDEEGKPVELSDNKCVVMTTAFTGVPDAGHVEPDFA
nr:hypothetical protein [Lachnospiraceae bacterium]